MHTFDYFIQVDMGKWHKYALSSLNELILLHKAPDDTMIFLHENTRALSQYKDDLSRYRDFHYEDNMVMRPSSLYNETPYIGTMTSSYWNVPQTANRDST